MNVATAFGPLCAFLSSVTWAIGTTTYSRLSKTHSAFRINLTRAAFSLPCFVLAVFVVAGGWRAGLADFRALDPAHLRWLLASVVSSYALGDIFFMLSTHALGVPGALAISSSSPVVAAIFSAFWLRQPLPPLKLAGLFITVAGIALVILNDPKPVRAELPDHDVPLEPTVIPLRSPLLRRKSAGVALAVLSAIFWAGNSVSVAQGGRGVDAMAANSARMAFSIVLILAFGALAQRKIPAPLPWPTVRPVLWVFVVEAFLGSFFFLYGLSHTASIVYGCILASLAPVLSVPVALVLKLERWSLVRTAAIAVVVIGICVLSAP